MLANKIGMTEPKPSRPFQQRVIDSFDRSTIRDVAKASAARKRRSPADGLKKRYATLMLGASLAVGGVGVPLKMASGSRANSSGEGGTSLGSQIASDLARAHAIAKEVGGGVEAAAGSVASLNPAEAAPQQMTLITEKVKEEFFKTEVPFGELIYKEALKNDLAPELVAAVVKTESQFKPNAKSPANAQGLMQLVPRTGKWMGAKNLMNPVENVQAGTKYLKYLNERFDGDQTKVLAAYNAGEGNVRKFGGVPPFKETRNYVKKVAKYSAEFENRIEERVVDHVAQETLPAR
jgi:hypothetical protein